MFFKIHNLYPSFQKRSFVVYTSCYAAQNIYSSLAKIIKKMHKCGIVFGDLNNRNILITKKNGNVSFFFVDLNRMKLRKKISVLKGMFDLSWLHIPEEHKAFFFKEYSENDFSNNLWVYTIIKKYRLLVDRTKIFFRYLPRLIITQK